MVVAVVPVAIGICVVAFTGLIFLYAMRDFLPFIVRHFGFTLGPIGTALVERATSMVDAAITEMESWIHASVTPAAHAIVAIPHSLNQLVDIAIDVLYALWFGIIARVDATATGIVGAASSALYAAIAVLQAKLDTLTNQAIPALQYAIADVAAQTRARFDELTRDLWLAYESVRSELYTMIGAETQARMIDVADARAGALAAAQSIEAGINDRVGALVSTTATYLNDRITTVDGRVTTLANELERLIPGISDRIRQLELDDVAAGVAAATTAAAIAKLIKECIDPLCSTVGKEVPFLQGVQSMLVLGLLAGLLANAIRDPEGAARGADSLVSEPIGAVMGFLNELAA
jgi:phage-related protein